MIQAEEDMQYCLEAAERVWRQAFIVIPSPNTKDDIVRYKQNCYLTPEAIAIIAGALFNRKNDK